MPEPGGGDVRLYLSSFRIGRRPDELLGLLGGRTRVAVIANAADDKCVGQRAASVEREVRDLRQLGLDPVELDLRAYFGRAASVQETLAGFDLLWVRGGNPFILRRAMLHSGVDAIVRQLLCDDALVYAGYSAGVVMLCQSLHGFEAVDSPDLVPEGYDVARPVWECLGLLPYAVLPHYRSDHPESASMEHVVQYMIDHHRLFVALRDGEVIVRDGEREAVLG